MITPEQAAQAAAEALAGRTDAVAALAQARIDRDQAITAAREELREVQARTEATIKAAEKNAKDAWNAALKTGWTPAELARLGIKPPRTASRPRSRHASAKNSSRIFRSRPLPLKATTTRQRKDSSHEWTHR